MSGIDVNSMTRTYTNFMKCYGPKKTSALSPSFRDHLAEKIESLLSERTGSHVVLDHKTDPSIIGGFVFEMDGYRLDASASGRLDRLRKELVEENSRLV